MRSLPCSLSDGASKPSQMCHNLCDEGGYVYFGTEYASECWCGDETAEDILDENGPAINCDMSCSGDNNQFCGGYDAISVSRVHETAVGDGAVIGEKYEQT